MAEITAALVKSLRERTGAGMMDAKRALGATDGDMAAAEDWLRTKMGVKADKKAGRAAAEGLIGAAVENGVGALVEVNSETDFVARNAEFQAMVGQITRLGLDVDGDGDVEALKATAAPGTDGDVQALVKSKVGAIGENMSVRRFRRVAVRAGVVVSYVHAPAAKDMGKIGVLIGLESAGDAEKLKAFGKQLAMHAAATAPAALSETDLDPALVEREKQLLADEARQSGKPEAVIEKMIVGRLNKFYKEVCFLKQDFVINPEITVERAVADAAKEAGGEVALTSFAYLKVGEGVETSATDFAAEVAAQTGGRSA